MFNPIDFYTLASDLYTKCAQDKAEAEYRNIIGRAYYAAFLRARDVCGVNGQQGSIHQQVALALSKKDSFACNKLNILRDMRNDADYNLSKTIQKRDAGKALKFSEEILTLLDKPNSQPLA